jgi:hypothetical protein
MENPMVKFNIVNQAQEIDGATYQHKDCLATRNRADACDAKNEDAVSVPSILTLKSPYGFTYFNDDVSFKLNLDDFGSDLSVRGYFNQHGLSQETVLMIFNKAAQHVHTFIASGYHALSKSTIIGNDSSDLIDGLTKKIGDITYFNSHCDYVERQLHCKPVTIDSIVKPTQFHVCNLSSGDDKFLTRIEQPLPSDYIINVAQLGVTENIDIKITGKNKSLLGFKDAGDKVVYEVMLDLAADKISDSLVSYTDDSPYIC